MKNKLKIIFVIIATLVGAGFASGKEIYSFFFIYGIEGILGIIISSAIINYVVYKVFSICVKNNIKTYKEFCNNIVGTHSEHIKLANLLNNMVNIFLLITFYIMISGFSSFLKQEFNINRIIGSIIIILLCYFTMQKNVKGLIKISDYLIPFLIIFLIFVSSKNIKALTNYKNIFENEIVLQKSGIIKSILYASYNCIILIPVLIPLTNIVNITNFNKKKEYKNNKIKAKNKTQKNIIYVSIISFITVVLLSFSIYNLLLTGNSKIFQLDMPIIEIVKRYGKPYQLIYTIMIALSIFTTALSAGCGILSNNTSNNKFKIKLTIMCISAIILSQISFSTLVNLMYPVLGIIGFLEILQIAFIKE